MKPWDPCACALEGWRTEWERGHVSGKELKWARRTGPDAGESGQLLHLTTTQHVSRREGTEFGIMGNAGEMKVFYRLTSLMLDLDPSFCCLCSGSPSNLITNYNQKDGLKRQTFPSMALCCSHTPSQTGHHFQEKGTGSLTVAHGALRVQPHLPSISSLSFPLLSLQEPSLYPGRA